MSAQGGIGEKSAELRSSISSRLRFLSVKFDSSRNAEAGKSKDSVVEISTSSSAFKLLRVLTDEELECAQLALETEEVKRMLS